jgi:hypothetical protein
LPSELLAGFLTAIAWLDQPSTFASKSPLDPNWTSEYAAFLKSWVYDQKKNTKAGRMTVISVLLIASFLVISWRLCCEVYRGTEQGLPHAHRYHRH